MPCDCRVYLVQKLLTKIIFYSFRLTLERGLAPGKKPTWRGGRGQGVVVCFLSIRVSFFFVFYFAPAGCDLEIFNI